jgi:catechol 2,3-dioxygenase-like lactoylglutathione lyase family enzyme
MNPSHQSPPTLVVVPGHSTIFSTPDAGRDAPVDDARGTGSDSLNASGENAGVTIFRTPQIVLFSDDVERAATFYEGAGFSEVFRTPAEGAPVHVDLELDGYRIGLASEESTRIDHGLAPADEGQRAAVILWTDDTAAGYLRLQELGATPVKAPSLWLERLLIAWVEDLDGHLVQVVQATEAALD